MKNYLIGVLLAGLVAGFLAGCNREERVFHSHAEENMHPQPEFYPPAGYEETGNEWIDRSDLAPEDYYQQPGTPLSEVFGRNLEVSSWGEEDDLLLEQPVSAAMVGKWLVVLDAGRPDLKIIDTETNEIEVVGGPGQGPMEFQGPRDIDVIDDHTFRVWDGNRSVKTISLEGGGWVEEDVREIGIRPDFGCQMGDKMVAFGLEFGEGPHHVVHVLDEEGQVTGSIGDAYVHSDFGAVLNSSSLGGAACFPESGQVVYTFREIPIILSYSIEGELEWVKYLNPFVPVKSELTENGIRSHSPESNTSMILNLKRVEETNQFLIQMARLDISRPEGVERLFETVILDASDGREVERTMAPWLFEVGPNHVITIPNWTEVNLIRKDR